MANCSKAALAGLHEDLLSAVFSHLDVTERSRASRVCRKWRAAALQPPHSTALALRVLLTDGLKADPADVHTATGSDEERLREAAEWLRKVASSTGVSLLRVVLPLETTAVLRGPLCGGLRRLSLDLVLPRDDTRDADAGAPSLRSHSRARGGGFLFRSSISVLGAIGAALPPALRALSVVGLGPGFASAGGKEVLRLLDLERTAPALEDLEIALGIDRPSDFAALGLSHPSLRRLGARLTITPDGDLPGPGPFSGLPRLQALGLVDVQHASGDRVRALVPQSVRAERLELSRAVPSDAHARLLRPGSVLLLFECGLPAVEDWALPSGLAELRLERCTLSPASLRFLLHRTSTYAPGLGRLVIRLGTRAVGGGSDGQCSPEDVVAALAGVPGGTQIALLWPESPSWRAPWILAPLARALASSPALHGFVHCALPPQAAASGSLPPDVAHDLAAYRRARAAALRGMGEAGRRLLAEQGYDHVHEGR